MTRILYLIISLLMSGCVITKIGGGYPVYGVVVDKYSGDPIKGASVYLEYSANSFWGSHKRTSEVEITNEIGEFSFTPEKVLLVGGTGGLAGSSNRWPLIWFTKEGCSRQAISFREANKEKYQDLRLELKCRGTGT